MSSTNPYRFSIPVGSTDAFVGRRAILEDLFSDLGIIGARTMASLYGGRNIGTTSILQALANPSIQKKYGRSDLAEWRFGFVDFKVLESINPDTITTAIIRVIEQITGATVLRTGEHYRDLKEAGDAIESTGGRVILLIDEIDRLVELEADYAFFDGLLYTLLNRTIAPDIITASKRPIYELFIQCIQQHGYDLGSPYFVHFRPIRIGLFTPEEVRELIFGLSEQAGISLKDDYRRISRLAGRMPLFLQIASYLYFHHRTTNNPISRATARKIAGEFKKRGLPYYKYYWDCFSATERELVTLIALDQQVFFQPPDSQSVFAQKLGCMKDDDDLMLMFPTDHVARTRWQLDMAAFSTNSKMFFGAMEGTIRLQDVSEWIWSIIYGRGSNYKLFSPHFQQFIKEMVGSQRPIPVRSFTLDIVHLLSANLRRHFEHGAPSHEEEVQRAIQLILDAAGYNFDREAHQFTFSLKGWRPDHVSRCGIAIEAKLCTDKAKCKRIVEEISADILPYRSRYDAVIVVIYDLGIIDDEVRFRYDFERHSGVYVLIRKH